MVATSTTAASYLKIGDRKLPIPRSRTLRVALAFGLILGAAVPLVPPGVSALPVGLALLSIDYPQFRRPRRRMVVWGGRKLQRLKRHLHTDPPSP